MSANPLRARDTGKATSASVDSTKRRQSFDRNRMRACAPYLDACGKAIRAWEKTIERCASYEKRATAEQAYISALAALKEAKARYDAENLRTIMNAREHYTARKVAGNRAKVRAVRLVATEPGTWNRASEAQLRWASGPVYEAAMEPHERLA